MFSGSIVALMTPLFQDQVDKKALQDLIEWHVQEGTHGILVCGCTGEGALLTPEERSQVLSLSLEVAHKRIPILMGCSSPSTTEVVQMVQEAEQLGAAAAVVVPPYFVKPMPEGIFQHFQAIAQTSRLPLIVYNNPGRVGIDLSVSLLARLATLPTIIGVKDSGTDMRKPIQLRQIITKSFCFLSGDDPTTVAYLAKGGDGSISVTANVAPKLYRQMMDAWQGQDLSTFSKLRDQLFPLHEALLAETNPSPLKFAMSLLGKCQNEVRLPLMPVSSQTEKGIKQAMEAVGVLA